MNGVLVYIFLRRLLEVTVFAPLADSLAEALAFPIAAPLATEVLVPTPGLKETCVPPHKLEHWDSSSSEPGH